MSRVVRTGAERTPEPQISVAPLWLKTMLLTLDYESVSFFVMSVALPALSLATRKMPSRASIMMNALVMEPIRLSMYHSWVEVRVLPLMASALTLTLDSARTQVACGFGHGFRASSECVCALGRCPVSSLGP